MQATNIVTPIIDALGEFIRGIGTNFLTAFQTVFMNSTVVDGVETFSGINNFGLLVLVFFGVSLGYGVVRYVVGLFRREAN